jgi:hypothetical protein
MNCEKLLTKECSHKINEDFLCVLKKSRGSKLIELGCVEIVKLLPVEIDGLNNICDDNDSSLGDIMQYIKNTHTLNVLYERIYKYALKLNGSFQQFNSNIENLYSTILNFINKINEASDTITIDDSLKSEANGLKKHIKSFFNIWHDAHSISATYQNCEKDPMVLSYSHRITGWSSPIYELTEYFSYEVKTNFGYGNSSYFYIILRYRNIIVTPFSDWINYELASYKQIIRYTRSFELENASWLPALEFVMKTCNLSIINEQKFIEEYIIKECEKMTAGLEIILQKETFEFKNNDGYYKKQMNGYILSHFRGEKISGALNFISKIIEFESKVNVSKYIERIESVNIKIKPILSLEIPKILKEANVLKENIDVISANLLSKQKEHEKLVIIHDSKITEFLGEEDSFNPVIDLSAIDQDLSAESAIINKFYKEIQELSESLSKMNKQHSELIRIHNDIVSFESKINIYFEGKSQLS